MRHRIRAWAMILALTAAAAAQKDMDVFLLIGQSNMAGRGPMIKSDSTTDIEGAWLLKDTIGWEAARNPLNRYSTIEYGYGRNQVGPGFGFARELHRLSPKTKIGLVVNARGGTSLSQWVKGTNFYSDALARTRFAMKTGTLKGILWHQGEADRDDTAYVTRLAAFIDSLRKDFGRPDLPFIAGQLGPWGTRFAGHNARILTLPKRVGHTAVVRTDSLNHTGDSTHFDRAGQIKLGTRYATAAWSLVYKDGTVNLAAPVRPAGPRAWGLPMRDALGRMDAEAGVAAPRFAPAR